VTKNNVPVYDGFEEQARPKLSDADRALMMTVAERELSQGKISIEEYDYIVDRCRVSFGDTLRDLASWLKKAVPFTTDVAPRPRRRMTPRRT
jgi:hypothetical protein